MTWIVLNYCLAKKLLYEKVRWIVNENCQTEQFLRTNFHGQKTDEDWMKIFSDNENFPLLRSLRVIFLVKSTKQTQAHGKSPSFPRGEWFIEHVEILFLENRNHRFRQMSARRESTRDIMWIIWVGFCWVIFYFSSLSQTLWITEGKNVLIPQKITYQNSILKDNLNKTKRNVLKHFFCNTIKSFVYVEKFFYCSFFRPADLKQQWWKVLSSKQQEGRCNVRLTWCMRIFKIQ